MGLADRFKRLTKKAEATAAEHREQIHEAVAKAEVAADQRTGGKYHEQIQQIGTKADEFVEGLEQPARSESAPEGGSEPTPPGAG